MPIYRCAKIGQMDIPELWQIVKEYPDYFDDGMKIKNLNNFRQWVNDKVIEGVVVWSDGRIAGFGYIDDIYNSFGRVGIFTKRKSLSNNNTVELSKSIIPYLFEAHNLKMLYGIVRVKNLACIKYLKRIGFKVTGVLKNHVKFNNIETDCVIASMLRESVL